MCDARYGSLPIPKEVLEKVFKYALAGDKPLGDFVQNTFKELSLEKSSEKPTTK